MWERDARQREQAPADDTWGFLSLWVKLTKCSTNFHLDSSRNLRTSKAAAVSSGEAKEAEYAKQDCKHE